MNEFTQWLHVINIIVIDNFAPEGQKKLTVLACNIAQIVHL